MDIFRACRGLSRRHSIDDDTISQTKDEDISASTPEETPKTTEVGLARRENKRCLENQKQKQMISGLRIAGHKTETFLSKPSEISIKDSMPEGAEGPEEQSYGATCSAYDVEDENLSPKNLYGALNRTDSYDNMPAKNNAPLPYTDWREAIKIEHIGQMSNDVIDFIICESKIKFEPKNTASISNNITTVDLELLHKFKWIIKADESANYMGAHFTFEEINDVCKQCNSRPFSKKEYIKLLSLHRHIRIAVRKQRIVGIMRHIGKLAVNNLLK